jgi:hypothetical protein
MALDFGLPLFCGGRGKEATEFLPPQIGSHSPLMRDYGKELGPFPPLESVSLFNRENISLFFPAVLSPVADGVVFRASVVPWL